MKGIFPCCFITLIGILSLLLTADVVAASQNGGRMQIPTKTYTCLESGMCGLNKPGVTGGIAQDVCLLTCGKGTLWPYPTGDVQLGSKVTHFQFTSTKSINFNLITPPPSQSENKQTFLRLLEKMEGSFLSELENMQDSGDKKGMRGRRNEKDRALREHHSENKKNSHSNTSSAGKHTKVEIDISIKDNSVLTASLENDESYTLNINTDNESPTIVKVSLTANTLFGMRHGLETLSQLIAYDNQLDMMAIASDNVMITDKPAFRYRGVMVDVSRHFISLDKLTETVRALGYNKMNVLHLHLSDTSSIPMTFPSQPEVTMNAAYDNDMMFTVDDIAWLVDYATIHGVMILPEIDAPAHMNAGWQWGPDAGLGELVLCADAYGTEGNTWSQDAMGPPGGQFNLVNENAYNILRHLYKDTITQFSSSSYFHLGGDEVIVGSDETSKSCYNSTSRAQPILDYITAQGLDRSNTETFYGLWQNFTLRATEMVQKEYLQQTRLLKKLHIWGGGGVDSTGVAYNLMERDDVTRVLPPSLFTIQVWDTTTGSIVPRLIRDQGYEVVLSNTDYVYLDCGDSGWAFAGGYWCQPYHEWYHIYQYVYDITQKWSLSEEEKQKIVGSETLIWTEKTDDLLVSQKVWPRSAALAEALWSDPQDGWYAADSRMQQWRNKLVKRGIDAEPLQPMWCQQRAGDVCTLNSGTPQ